jgi:exopolysaccharide biosynthesis protein
MAPVRWERPHPLVANAVAWRTTAEGVDAGEFTLQGTGEAWRIRLILVRIDPAAVRFVMAVPPRQANGFAGRWSIEDAPADALVALNAGQFTSGPWGWLVTEGVVRQPKGSGPLAPGVAFTRAGQALLVPPDSLASLTDVAEGFQSFPVLLAGDGEVPPALRTAGSGVDLTHRDGRLALGVLRDGRVLVALTRFEGLGGVLEVVPFGFTTPEMAAIMGALGATRAVLLDGGISGQLLLNDRGHRQQWKGLRRVAAGLVVLPRHARR